MGSENAAVNWGSLLEDWNSVMSVQFTNPRAMLKFVYAEQQTYKKTGKVFLLTSPTIAKYMYKWGLECLPAGHRGDSPCVKAIKALGDVSKLDTKQISKQVGFSRARVTALLQIHEIDYKQLRKTRNSTHRLNPVTNKAQSKESA